MAEPQVRRDRLGAVVVAPAVVLGTSAEVVAPLVDAGVHVLDREALLVYGQQAGEIGQAGGGIDEPVAVG